MTPDLSRRVGKIMNTPAIVGLSPADKDAFIADVSKADSFSSLSVRSKALIAQAEANVH